MSLWHPSRLVSKADFETHRTSTPIDHPDRSVTKVKLEYPTEDVCFTYLKAIDKLQGFLKDFAGDWSGILTSDSFADKATQALLRNHCQAYVRASSGNGYAVEISTPDSTKDFRIAKMVNNSVTLIATESVDLDDIYYTCKLSVSGSALEAYRDDMASPKLSTTDTDLASGWCGVGRGWGEKVEMEHIILYTYLRAPSTPAPPAMVIIEVEVTGSGKPSDPFRPALAEELSSKGDMDYASVTWGLFDHKEGHATMLVFITGDNPYKPGAIDKQKQNTKRNFTPPKDYTEAIDLYRSLKADYPSWLAGKDNFAYQCLGWELLDLFQNADFYYGEFIEHKTHYDQLKRVPSFEVERRVKYLIDKLSKVDALHTERDKHLKKLQEILKLGW